MKRAQKDDALTHIRELCMALPATVEKLSHGVPTFFAGGKKTFVMFLDDHHGDGRLAIWCAAPPGVQATLVDEEPERFFVPAYVGHRGWVGVRLDVDVDWDEVGGIIEDGWREVATKRLITEHDASSLETGDVVAEAQAMGGGVKQRDVIKMTEAEVDAFLVEGRTMSFATINHDDTIHVVAMWYGYLEGEIAFETKLKSQKVRNLLRKNTITCMVEDGKTYEELRGVELVGTAEIIDDPDRMFELGISVFERYQGPYSEEMKPFVEIMLNKRVVVKVKVDRVVSWDHRKLGLPPTNPAG